MTFKRYDEGDAAYGLVMLVLFLAFLLVVADIVGQAMQPPSPKTQALKKIAQDGIECRITSDAPMPPDVE